jgi:ParB-like chromosome segregation protein Spo0J
MVARTRRPPTVNLGDAPENPLTPITTNRRPDIEQWLDMSGVLWEFREGVPLKEFDFDASRHNQARIQPINLSWVASMVRGMERGDIFPPVVAHRPNDKLVIIDGNHRLTAAQRTKHEEIDTYEVVGTPEMILKLMVEANQHNGNQFTHEEALRHACELIDAGYTHKDAADSASLPESQVHAEYTRVTVERRARRLRIVGWNKLPAPVKVRLNNIRSDEVLREAGKYAAWAKLSTNDLSRLVTEVNRRPNEQAQLSYISTEAQKRRKADAEDASTVGYTKRGSMGKTGRVQFLVHTAAILAVGPAKVVTSAVGPEQLRAIADKADELQQWLTDLQHELKLADRA